MRNTDADKLFQTFLEAFPVDELSRAAADSAYTNDTVIGYSVEAVAPRLGCSPADVVDDGDTVFAQPISERAHTVCIVDLERFGKILICGKIRCDCSGKMTENF